MISKSLLNRWRIGNDNGKGYALGDNNMTPAEAAEDCGLEIIDEDHTGNVVARLLHGDNSLVVIRDHNGPWAVKVTVG